MKNHILLGALAVAAIVPISEAATINVGRGFGNLGLIAQGFGGTPLATGGYYIAVGTFAAAEPTFTDFTSIQQAATNSFSIFQSALSPTSGPTIGTITGSFTAQGGANPEVFNTSQIYFLVGDGDSLETSNALGFFKVTTDFPADVSAGGATSVTLGDSGDAVQIMNAGSFPTANTFQLVAIPEPSIALLGLFGAVGLVRRRR